MSLDARIASLKYICVGTLAGLVLAVLARLVRWTYVFPTAPMDRSQGAVITFWHGRILMAPWLYWKLRGKRSAAPYMLISQHGDGRIIAVATRLLGIRSVAGSSSRGGLRALLELIRVARDGSDIGFTPDGPRGPRYEVKEGVILAAVKTGHPILPCTYSTQHRWQLRSWDGMIVPKPFSRGVVIVGEPIVLTADEDPEVARKRVQSALRAITTRADQFWASGGAETEDSRALPDGGDHKDSGHSRSAAQKE